MALTKLKITAFSESNFSGNEGSMTVQINPETYKVNYGVNNDPEEGQIKTAGGRNYSKKVIDFKDATVSFDIWFDSTGALEDSEPVQAQIIKFRKLAVKFNGTEHSTNYLKLNWGTLDFGGQLISFDVNYELFDPDGTPLRAKVGTTFKGYVAPKEEATSDSPSSPDLSHVYTIKAGDTLPLMCFRVYGDSKYYGQVAEANGLSSFMYIQPGKKILFPPLDKFEYNANVTDSR